MSAFAIVVAAGFYDAWLVRRSQRLRERWRPRRKLRPDFFPSSSEKNDSEAWLASAKSGYDELKKVPCRERPRMLVIKPYGWRRLGQRPARYWFAAMLLISAVGPIAAAARGAPWMSVALLAVMGLVVGERLFVFHVAGVVSTNTGTYFRDKEPLRFWCSTAILSALYIMLLAAGLLAPISQHASQ